MNPWGMTYTYIIGTYANKDRWGSYTLHTSQPIGTWANGYTPKGKR